GAVRAVSYQQEPRRNLLLHAIENLDYVAKALDRAKVGNMDQNALVFIGKLSPPLDCFGVAHVNVAVHKVVDHLDRIANLKLLKSAFLQVIGDGCNAIAHFNGISSYGKIREIGRASCRERG